MMTHAEYEYPIYIKAYAHAYCKKLSYPGDIVKIVQGFDYGIGRWLVEKLIFDGRVAIIKPKENDSKYKNLTEVAIPIFNIEPII